MQPDSPRLPVGDLFTGATYAADVVECPDDLRPAVERLLAGVVVVDDLAAARSLVRDHPHVTAVTREGDVLGAHFAAGGSAHQPSLLEVQAAVDEAADQLASAAHTLERLGFDTATLEREREEAQRRVDVALAKLHESDATLAAVAEELGQYGSQTRNARAEAARLDEAIEAARAARDADLSGLAELESRLAAVQDAPEEEPDLTERDRLAEQSRAARSSEMDARLALRTTEERARALHGRADSLRRPPRGPSARPGPRPSRAASSCSTRGGSVRPWAVPLPSCWPGWTSRSPPPPPSAAASRPPGRAARPSCARRAPGCATSAASSTSWSTRPTATRWRGPSSACGSSSSRSGHSRSSVSTPSPWSPSTAPTSSSRSSGEVPEGEEPPAPVPFDREQQAKRLRSAERSLGQLGRINPLALEEFSALEERHKFLTEQLEDLRSTRRDLLDIVTEVDQRVEQVFTEAYADVERAFEQTFARLFPGGEGRLVLTDPDDMLATGVEVEARPPGKKVKRLSLLSGGERSLVAVAFLVALFKARPSPFYILDEVEAALDDTNLGRLLQIYEELREDSQLLVITHQKRTMEVGDALYGVTMRGDGVSAVISQRLREQESA